MNRILIYLSRPRGLILAERLHREGHGVAALVGLETCLQRIGAKEVADRIGARTLFAPARINEPDFVAGLEELEPELGVIAGYHSIFGTRLIDVPRHGTINLHPGRLPAYRGGSPLNWQIINGETSALITVTRVLPAVDEGPILATCEVKIGPDDTIAQLHERSDAIFPDLVMRVIDSIARGSLVETPQETDGACYWHQRADPDGQIFWREMTEKRVHDLVRAVTRPYPGAFAFWRGRKLRIFRTRRIEERLCGTPGRILYLNGRGPFVVCRDRALLVEEYEAEDAGPVRWSNGDLLE